MQHEIKLLKERLLNEGSEFIPPKYRDRIYINKGEVMEIFGKSRQPNNLTRVFERLTPVPMTELKPGAAVDNRSKSYKLDEVLKVAEELRMLESEKVEA